MGVTLKTPWQSFCINPCQPVRKFVEARKVDQQRRGTSKGTKQMVSRHPAKKTRRKAPVWLWLVLTAIGALSATAGALLAISFTAAPLQQRNLSAEDAAFFNQGGKEAFSRSLLQVPEVTRPVNILLLGIKTNISDLKNGELTVKEKGYNAEINSLDGLSDTIMLIRFDPQSQRIVIMGIPRDTQIERDGRVEKINAVDQESGTAAAAKEISKLMGGVAIDRYIRMNNMGVVKLIDALGGVTVTVPKDIKYQDDSQHFYVNLKAGRQHLDGQKLIGLLRFRNDANGDIGRMQRQQMVMKALTEQVVNPMTVARIPQLFSVVQSHVDTNLTVEELLAIGGFSLHTGKSKMQMLMLPGDYNGDGKHSVSYWLPDAKGIKNMMARYFDQGNVELEEVSAARLRINIQDTTHFPDATKRLIAKLRKAGYENIHLDTNLKIKEDLSETKIIAQKGDPIVAQGVAQALGFGEVNVETSGNLYTDVTIKLGRDWLQKEQQYKVQNGNKGTSN
jgi:polyisoprenyl-teichoic acid--peptidoglycan teichoic acid transferase